MKHQWHHFTKWAINLSESLRRHVRVNFEKCITSQTLLGSTEAQSLLLVSLRPCLHTWSFSVDVYKNTSVKFWVILSQIKTPLSFWVVNIVGGHQPCWGLQHPSPLKPTRSTDTSTQRASARYPFDLFSTSESTTPPGRMSKQSRDSVLHSCDDIRR